VAEQKYIIGIDGGGTKCKARLYSTQDGFLSAGLSGSANPAKHYETAIHSIVEACQNALDNAGLSQLKLSDLDVGMGLAGVNIESCRLQMQNWQHPFKSCFITTDLHIACLGANNQPEGAVIIVGTGSSALLIKDGQSTMLGGHGFPVGDYGSGAWLGFEALRYSLRSMDGLVEASELNQAILKFYNCSAAIEVADLMYNATPSEFARLAPVVFDLAEKGDVAAKNIVQSGAEQITQLTKKLLAQHPARLCMIGGVSERLKPWFAPEIRAQIQSAINQPDHGAVLFALNQLGLSTKI